MEFDKSRVYTAVNANELQIGSKCIFADTVKGLRRKVEEDANCVETFYRLHNNGCDDLFVGNDCAFCYAYLIEPPDEPKYKPFESVDKAMEAIKKHGGWVKWKDDDIQGLVVGKSDDRVKILQDWVLPEELFEGYVFADDGSPCGELEL
ncbi:hypothetical protein E4N95_10995 [Treponema denticola]|uniref:hypothetical protein n=1 Tax=Treponema denticola TaxID=158 RepID=UPI003D8B1D80